MSAAVLGGHCVPCQRRGELSIAADRTGTLCQFHVRMGFLARSRPGAGGSSSTPPRRPGRRAATGPKGWQRRFLRSSAVRKAPRATGSKRRLSPDRLEDHAALLVVQAVTARHVARPIAWLAVVLYDLDVNRPPGASRLDARSNIAKLAAVLAVSADWRSGRRSRPGRQVAAGLLARCERTITRHCALLQTRELARREDDGRLLTATERAAAQGDEDVSPDQRQRWVDRAEWTLLIPAWVREVTDEQLAPYIAQAAALLDDLAVPARGLAVDGPGDRPVDNRPGQTAFSGSVTPSFVLKVLGSLPCNRGSFSRALVVDKPPTAPSPVRAQKEQKGGASRHSSTTEGSGSRPRMTAGAARLARQIVADSRFPFIPDLQNPWPIAGVLNKLGLGHWTVDDVDAEAQLRLAECGKAMLAKVKAPASYLQWLLGHAVPSEPPAQITAALAESARAVHLQHAAARARRWDERDALAVPAAASVGGREARRLAAEAADRARQARGAR